jgi:hypothetical protein
MGMHPYCDDRPVVVMPTGRVSGLVLSIADYIGDAAVNCLLLGKDPSKLYTRESLTGLFTIEGGTERYEAFRERAARNGLK